MMEEIRIQNVQHFVEDHSSAEAFRWKSALRRRIPERRAQSYHIGRRVWTSRCVLASACPFTVPTAIIAVIWLYTRAATSADTKGNCSSPFGGAS